MTEKHEKTFNCYAISYTKEGEVRDIVQLGWGSDIILHFLKVEVLLSINQNQNNT